ncbi:MAG: tetratricopeptide repeat protein [Acidobacteria bacterium]|nr:tetratricopeptide repeat protein [Acidobacteriota bacterium]
MQNEQHAERLRQRGLALVRSEQYDDAITLYDEAMLVVESEELRELLTINKADAMIAIERDGAEVRALPGILMRRRNPHHTFYAAYALMFKHRLTRDVKRALFYGEIALEVAREMDNSMRVVQALNDLGVLYESDSQFARAVEVFEEASTLVSSIEDENDRRYAQAAVRANSAYSLMLLGRGDEGIAIVHSVIDDPEGATIPLGDCYLGLCFAYLERDQLDRAEYYGRLGLDAAADPRQTRNSLYLLGEVAYHRGDFAGAERWFSELARFYPNFPNLTQLLLAVDLRSMIHLYL